MQRLPPFLKKSRRIDHRSNNFQHWNTTTSKSSRRKIDYEKRISSLYLEVFNRVHCYNAHLKIHAIVHICLEQICPLEDCIYSGNCFNRKEPVGKLIIWIFRFVAKTCPRKLFSYADIIPAFFQVLNFFVIRMSCVWSQPTRFSKLTYRRSGLITFEHPIRNGCCRKEICFKFPPNVNSSRNSTCHYSTLSK